MTVVIDASIAVKWVLDEEDSNLAASVQTMPGLIAPAIWLVEAANALWAHSLKGEHDAADAAAALARLVQAPVISIAIDKDIQAALAFAHRLRQSVYDCLYLALAVREKTHVLTADRRFFRGCMKDASLRRHLKLLGAA